MVQENESLDESFDGWSSLSLKQRKALTALLEGQGMSEAAASAGIGYSTLWRWMKEPLFYAELRAAEHAKFGEVSRALGAAGASAVSTLKALADSTDVPAGIRAKAANDLLGRQIQARELGLTAETLETLAMRLAAVEEALKAKG